MKQDARHYFKLYSRPRDFHPAMLADIASAHTYIYMEYYRLGNDPMGMQYLDAITQKCKEGVKVKILLDDWGTAIPQMNFNLLRAYGGEVRYFKKIRFFIDFFTKNHRRNHRKLLIIDDEIVYIGSPNITEYSLDWRESQLRIEGQVAPLFRKAFLANHKLYNQYIFNKLSYKKTINFQDFEIVQDLPSIYRQQVKKHFEKLIQKAKYEVVIETPYFLPGYKLRRALSRATARGVKVTVMLPLHSDVRAVDLIRAKYMGYFYTNKIHIHYYTPTNLHSKLFLVDDEVYGIGSSNFDYRSFRYQYEIVLFGRHPEVIEQMRLHIAETRKYCVPFNYEAWLKRPRLEKVIGWMLLPFRHLF
ncbi:MAG: phosphatidylserine/phosphatidylglycerophosphate/cardiolipin synthase family protein [Lentimicrobiaceae bacterium]|nr:phosphatidylserine/phosphatidylglycerophosphate/cardiolipin synthase family protein [Lentimicrobiaceae bacterium]